MPRLVVNRLPSYRKHRASGQAIVNLNGQPLPRPYGTKASRTEYDRLIAEWLNRGKQPARAAAEITIMELLDGSLEHARQWVLADHQISNAMEARARQSGTKIGSRGMTVRLAAGEGSPSGGITGPRRAPRPATRRPVERARVRKRRVGLSAIG
jgi:hypothetical protein